MTLHICRICEQFPPLQGGLSTGMLQLSMAQCRQGHKVTVITRATGDTKDFDSDMPFAVVRIESARISRFAWEAYNIYKELKPRPDIIHTHGPSAAVFNIRKRSLGAPIVHTMHSLRKYQYELFERYKNSLRREKSFCNNSFSYWSIRVFKELLLERLVAKKADHLCLVAKYFRSKLRDYYKVPEERTTVILNGTNYDWGSSDLKRKSADSKRTEPIVLYVGRFEWHKRADVLIRAHYLVVKRIPSCRLILVGSGEMDSCLETLIKKLNLTHKVYMAGWLDQKKLQELYSSADCLCLPSVSEGLPKVLLEAMAMGIPVVASDNIAHRELLQHGEYGHVVGSPDPKLWAEVILRIISGDPVAQMKAEKAKQLIESNYRWEHVAKRIDGAYEKLVSMCGQFS